MESKWGLQFHENQNNSYHFSLAPALALNHRQNETQKRAIPTQRLLIPKRGVDEVRVPKEALHNLVMLRAPESYSMTCNYCRRGKRRLMSTWPDWILKGHRAGLSGRVDHSNQPHPKDVTFDRIELDFLLRWIPNDKDENYGQQLQQRYYSTTVQIQFARSTEIILTLPQSVFEYYYIALNCIIRFVISRLPHLITSVAPRSSSTHSASAALKKKNKKKGIMTYFQTNNKLTN